MEATWPILGDKRYRPLPHWRHIQQKVWRRDREQKASGAAQSALYGAAFQIQAANTRAATNHVIQSTGAEITKAVQYAIWSHQPKGIERWRVMPMNIHDEIECVVADEPTLIESVKSTVLEAVESYRELVPLIKMEWKTHMRNWAGK